MITIRTVNARIRLPDGSLASGTITVTPNAAWEYGEGTERRKVAPTPITVPFNDGLLAQPLTLAPTKGAEHDKTGLYYIAIFTATQGNRRLAAWTERWELDATGPNVMEIDEVVQVVTEALPAIQTDHTHANKALLDSYTQSEAALATAVAHAVTAGNPHGTGAADVGADPAGTAAATVAAHEAAPNPHPQYATDADLNAHAAQANPHGTTAADVGADPAGTASALIAAHEAANDPHPVYAPRALLGVTVTGNYTLQMGDAGRVVEVNAATANTLTVPPNSSVPFPIGTVVELWQMGAGKTTIVAGSGVIIRTPSTLSLRAQYSSASLRKRSTDEWVLVGDLDPA